MKDVLIISKGAELVRVPLCNLVFIQANANYSEIVTLNGKRTLVSFQLGQIEDMIEEQLGEDSGDFLRIGRGYIINSAYAPNCLATGGHHVGRRPLLARAERIERGAGKAQDMD